MPELRTKARHGAFGLALVEVGHDAGHVRQRPDRLERRAALEVDEEERDAIGWMRLRERGEPGEQELALAAAGGARDERVRTGANEVDLEPCAGHHAHDGGERRT